MLIMTCSAAISQELIVKSFELDSNDMTAQLSERKDLNGMPCSLVKVHLAKSGAVFHGNIVGETSYEMSEYLVYMAQGSKWIDVRLNDYLPLKVYFPDYGVAQLEAKQTYVLTIILPNYVSLPADDEMTYFTLSVSPKNAVVFIDGSLHAIDADGMLIMRLHRGEHTYQILASGYETKSGEFTLGTERKLINVELVPSPSITSSATQDRQTFTVNGVKFVMIRVEGGTFTMGATSEQGSDAMSDEKPAHQVTLSTYSIGETEVTQELWKAVMGSNPSEFKGDTRPVEQVSWNDCQEFIKRLNEITGKTFRLPTEAEWEYAARGGGKSQGYKYSGSNSMDEVGWYWGNSGDTRLSGEWDYSKVKANHCQTQPVAQKTPNELGLYDMSGNVWEWCSDWMDKYNSKPQENPYGPKSGKYRMFRGGSWFSNGPECRSSHRDYLAPSIRRSSQGLRIALSE